MMSYENAEKITDWFDRGSPSLFCNGNFCKTRSEFNGRLLSYEQPLNSHFSNDCLYLSSRKAPCFSYGDISDSFYRAGCSEVIAGRNIYWMYFERLAKLFCCERTSSWSTKWVRKTEIKREQARRRATWKPSNTSSIIPKKTTSSMRWSL